jgi:hypothetical protein
MQVAQPSSLRLYSQKQEEIRINTDIRKAKGQERGQEREKKVGNASDEWWAEGQDRKEMKRKRCARGGRVPGELIGGRPCAWPSAAHTSSPSHRSSCQTPSSSNSTYERVRRGGQDQMRC